MSVAVIQVRPLTREVPEQCPGSGTEIIPGKHSDINTRIKPLPLTNGHGRYITVTTERILVSVREWPLHIAVINL
jgi:hypothetical protein